MKETPSHRYCPCTVRYCPCLPKRRDRADARNYSTHQGKQHGSCVCFVSPSLTCPFSPPLSHHGQMAVDSTGPAGQTDSKGCDGLGNRQDKIASSAGLADSFHGTCQTAVHLVLVHLLQALDFLPLTGHLCITSQACQPCASAAHLARQKRPGVTQEADPRLASKRRSKGE